MKEIAPLVVQPLSLESHAAEAWISRLRRIQGGNRINANTEQSLGNRLIQANHVCVHARQFRQEAGITDAREAIFFLLGIEFRKIIFLLPAQTRDVFASLLGNRRVRHEVRPGIGSGNREIVSLAPRKRIRIVDQLVAAERFLVEEDFRNASHRTVEISLKIFWKARDT